MPIEAGFDTKELSDLTKKMLSTAQKTYPDETKKFVRREGEKMKRNLARAYRSKTKKKTGNLMDGVNRSQPSIYAKDWQVRVRNRAPHAPLIEHGHEKWIHGKDTGEKVEGKHVAAQTTEEFKEIYPEEIDKFVDDLLEKGFGL